MLKRVLLASAFLLSACSAAEAPAPAPKDDFAAKLQADFPVTLSKIADGVWVHTTNYKLPGQSPAPVNGLVVVDGDEVILVDGAWGELITLSLLKKIKSETGKMPTKMIVTNHSSDRTAGVDAAEWQGLQIFTHPDTPSLAAAAGYHAPDTSVAALKMPRSWPRGEHHLIGCHLHAPQSADIYIRERSEFTVMIACLLFDIGERLFVRPTDITEKSMRQRAICAHQPKTAVAGGAEYIVF